MIRSEQKFASGESPQPVPFLLSWRAVVRFSEPLPYPYTPPDSPRDRRYPSVTPTFACPRAFSTAYTSRVSC